MNVAVLHLEREALVRSWPNGKEDAKACRAGVGRINAAWRDFPRQRTELSRRPSKEDLILCRNRLGGFARSQDGLTFKAAHCPASPTYSLQAHQTCRSCSSLLSSNVLLKMPVPVPLLAPNMKLNKSKYPPVECHQLPPSLSSKRSNPTHTRHNEATRCSLDGPSRSRPDISERGRLSGSSAVMHPTAAHAPSRVQTQTHLARHHHRPLPGTVPLPPAPFAYTPVEWNWEAEHRDRKHESKADSALHGAQPFQVDRRVLKELVRERTRADVGRITFLSSGACF